MTPQDDWDAPAKTRAEMLARLNLAEDLATASEDADLVFEIMALKARLNLPTTRPCVPPN
jgi:hypothetical protein